MIGLIVLILVIAYILFVPSHGVKYSDGYFYRASCEDNIKKLSDLRSVAKRVVGGLPASAKRTYVMWKLGRCVFVERPIDAQKPYLALTIDKGRELEICLDYSDKNTLYYVLIHELAHVMSFTTGHNKEFYKNMDRLVESAKAQGIYTGSSKKHVVFCGSHIDVD